MSNAKEAAMLNGALLECQGLKKSFVVRGQVFEALRGIDLSVARGEVCVITGRSGAGKSTLIALMGGLDTPTAGRVTVANGCRTGIIFQTFNLIPSWTAFENVESALIHSRCARSQRRKQVDDMLDSLDMAAHRNNLPHELSVGQQQKVAIARALVGDPSLILADQPAGDVDPDTARGIMALLLNRVRKQGATLVAVSHAPLPPCQDGGVRSSYRLEDGLLTREGGEPRE